MGKKAVKGTTPEAPVEALSAVDRTNSLVRQMLSVDVLIPDELNPNEMGEAEFNMLYDNIERMGVTDPILVRPHPEQEGMYLIVGGHHRWEVAKLHGFEEVPVTIVTDPNFDAEHAKFQMVRHNIIHGKMNPQKFMKLYQSLTNEYTEEVAAEMFGFTSEEEFRKLVQSTAKALPPEMKETFLEASKEIRTINDLAIVLNRLFSTYGDTVPYGYMIFDYGGQDHMWLRMKKHQKKDVLKLGELCQTKQVSVDSVLAVMLQLIAQGGFTQEAFDKAVDELPKVEVVFEEASANQLPSTDYTGSL